MKKYIIYVAVLGVGLLLGWLLFGGVSSQETDHNHEAETSIVQMWTCSMHPQIMQPEPGDCPICGMDLIPAEAGATGLTADQFKLTENAMALANIQTTVVGNNESENHGITLSGKIAENESANAVQVSYVSGRIEHLNVSFTGEDVRKGQLLATVYSPELYAAQQELITAVSLKASQPELYQAVRNKLKLWKLSDSQINNIETTGKVKENLPVYATVSGVVTEKLINEGDYIKQGQPLLKIANLGTVWANFDVYENQIALFKKGQPIEVTAKSYPGKVFKGKVDFIDPVLNHNTRTVNLRVVLKNTKGDFKPGMFVEAQIKSDKPQSDAQHIIPSTAVLWTGERSVVYLKSSKTEPVFEMHEVTLGGRQGDAYQVLEGLNAGDEIVTSGTFTVDAAAQLQGKKSMMNHAKVETMESDEIKTDRLTVSKDFQEQLKSVYNQYIILKDALVKGNSEEASEASQSLEKSLSKIDMKLLKENEAHMRWMSQLKKIESNSASISKYSKIEEQRQYFKGLSDALIGAIQSFGVNEKVFLEYCPMANNNQGAFWLSKEEKVLNPYFGDAMLTCGEVKQIIE
ncbi:efflux RND transporter periplasmic adaptor subunit [Aestuariibaculum marinum]|uniref:Efflux RND transporter periplasmic adaptor subunit n=1 Tax=Aestuariibaculum marinum TaxID=2683592 RepID=A0A8J6PYN4_9FLAO|nr:efflux RND transporter periplasmic adaptor subunit [Aestuariibaculum marinum]MBD0824917.1 efflux RND transporter periplasmic adaptor subunit [Aestuariibaculum marinum]